MFVLAVYPVDANVGSECVRCVCCDVVTEYRAALGLGVSPGTSSFRQQDKHSVSRFYFVINMLGNTN